MEIKKNSLQIQNSKPNIQMWIDGLGRIQDSERLKSCYALIKEGVIAVPYLIQVLASGDMPARWEASNALVFIRDTSAAPELVHALKDENQNVRWAAMEALIALGPEGLEPLLQALIQDFDSVWLREGAHHILNVLKRQRQLRQPSLLVLQALEGVQPEVTVREAAQAAWQRLFGSRKESQQ